MEQYVEPLRQLAAAITWEEIIVALRTAGPAYLGAVLALPIGTLLMILVMLGWARTRRAALRRLAYREITRAEKRRG
jgi:hypothetical protein